MTDITTIAHRASTSVGRRKREEMPLPNLLRGSQLCSTGRVTQMWVIGL
jgi:hypothetical protein